MGKDNDEAAGGFGNVFRDRLTYLMNGNNVYGKPVNTQELADEIEKKVRQNFDKLGASLQGGAISPDQEPVEIPLAAAPQVTSEAAKAQIDIVVDDEE